MGNKKIFNTYNWNRAYKCIKELIEIKKKDLNKLYLLIKIRLNNTRTSPVPVVAGWCRLVPVGAGWCRSVPVGAGRCRSVPVGAGWCRCRCWNTCAGADRPVPVPTDLCRCRPTGACAVPVPRQDHKNNCT